MRETVEREADGVSSVSYGGRFSLALVDGCVCFVSVKATARSLEAATGALRLPGPLDALGLQEKTVSG